MSRSTTSVMAAAAALLAIGVAGMALTEMRIRTIEDDHLVWTYVCSALLIVSFIAWSWRQRKALITERIGFVALALCIGGSALTSIAICRVANAALSDGRQLQCTTTVVDRHSGGNRRRVLYVELAPCDAFPSGTTLRVTDADFEAAQAGRRVVLRFREGALRSRWVREDALVW